MPKNRTAFWLYVVLASIMGLGFFYFRFILDWSGRPYCHKQIMLSFPVWMDEHGMDINSRTNPFPNINGKGAESLAEIREEMGGQMRWATGYRYVPGLRADDPGDLVLMYLDRPTRWIWHGQFPPTIFSKKGRIIVPVDFAAGTRSPSGPGEMSELVSTDEFRSRLTRTLDFIRTNQRPNWETVIAEHTKILNSLEHDSR